MVSVVVDDMPHTTFTLCVHPRRARLRSPRAPAGRRLAPQARWSLVLVLSCSSLAAPWQPFAAWRSRHAALLREAKGAVTESGPAELQPAVPWPRRWQELRATSDVAVVPASALSLALAAAELAKPTVVGRLFDAALAPSASLGALLPLLKRLAALALAQWALEITVGFLAARARAGGKSARRACG